jgi:hypothetical protein
MNGVDEETLRITLWNWFDKKQREAHSKVDNDGNLAFQSRSQKDSIWRQKRSAALQELFLTRSQWNHIYKILEIAKERIILEAKPTKEQDEIVVKLKEHLKSINTLADLKRYKRWASFRRPEYTTIGKNKIKTLDFQKSLLDRISFKKEHMLWLVLTKKEKEIKNLSRASKLVVKQIKHVVPTKKEEITVCCECDSTVVATPVFAALRHGKGKYFVECECKRTIWLNVSLIKDFDNLESYSKR